MPEAVFVRFSSGLSTSMLALAPPSFWTGWAGIVTALPEQMAAAGVNDEAPENTTTGVDSAAVLIPFKPSRSMYPTWLSWEMI